MSRAYTDRKRLETLGSYRGENKRGGLDTLPEAPVGGHPANDHFYKQVEMAVIPPSLAMHPEGAVCIYWGHSTPMSAT